MAPVSPLYTLISVCMFVSVRERENLCKCVCSGWREVSVLMSGNTRCFRFVLCSSYFNARISHVSKKRLFLLLENGIRHQDLGNNFLLKSHASRLSQPTEQGNTSMCLFFFIAALYSIVCTCQSLLRQFPSMGVLVVSDILQL